LLGSKRTHEWREGLEVAQDHSDGVERRLEGSVAYDGLKRMITSEAS
jgi:hypothetical protein